MQVTKAVTLKVKFYIEGLDEPAHDFTQTGEAVLKQVIADCFKMFQGPYTIQVLDMELIEGGAEDTNDDDVLDAAQHPAPLLEYTPAAQVAAPPPTAPPSSSSRRAQPSPRTEPPSQPPKSRL
jgi:hypothetical protein